MKFVLIILTFLFSSLTVANEACDNPKDDFDGLYCLNKIYQEADRELNANYRTLVPLLDATGKAKLKSGQLSWLNTRNTECSRKDATGFYVNLGCATSTTIQRSQFLQDRIRECKSSGCLNSRL